MKVKEKPKPKVIRDDAGDIRHFFIRYLRDRIEGLDLKNRTGLKLREYHMNCGRLQELVRLQGELEELIRKHQLQEDDEDL